MGFVIGLVVGIVVGIAFVIIMTSIRRGGVKDVNEWREFPADFPNASFEGLSEEDKKGINRHFK